MSNWKLAYGWYGHIIASDESSAENCEQDNVIVVEKKVFDRLFKDYGDCKLDERIQANALGVTFGESDWFLATGVAFSEGFKHYGTVFVEAEAREEPDVSRAADAEYIAAMKEIYGIVLPPCRPMVGCSSEN